MRQMQVCGVFIIMAFILSLSTTAAEQRSSPSLPAAAQANISAAIGQDNPDYSAKAVGSGIEMMNRGQKLLARFTSAGVEVRDGNVGWAMALRGYGHGNALTAVKMVAPQSRKNRVEYRRGVLTEWYANGPIGVEQGFTLKESPDKANGQPLTIALAVSGMKMTLDEKRTSVTLNENQGSTVLRYTGLVAFDASGKELRAWLDIQGERLLLKIEDAKARYPIVVDPWVQAAKLTASDGTGGNIFGNAVAISGDTVVIGAPNAGPYQGAVYVFVKPATGWADMTQTAKLTASDGGPYDELGAAIVGISGNTVVAGAYGHTINGNYGQGAAYVFVKPKDGWKNMTQTAELTASDGKSEDFLGNTLSICGDTVVAGADQGGYYHGGTGPGAAYVFVKPHGGWKNMTETAKLTASDGVVGDQLGASTFINGDTVVAGSRYATSSYSSQGASYVFVKPAGGWTDMTETAKLTASDGQANDNFGWSTAIKGNTVVVGAPQSGPLGPVGPGAVYLFVEPATGWTSMTETAKLTSSGGKSGDALGAWVFFGGYRVVAGAPYATIGSKQGQGAAYVFAKPVAGWSTTSKFNAKLIALDGKANDNFGPVSICNGTVVVGAGGATINGNQQQGAAYVFDMQ